MDKKENKKRTVEKFAWLPTPVNKSRKDKKTVWVWFKKYYEDQEYVFWNDWQEGVGNNWKWSWRCKYDFRDLESAETKEHFLLKMNNLLKEGKIVSFRVVKDDSDFDKVEIYAIDSGESQEKYVGRFLNK